MKNVPAPFFRPLNGGRGARNKIYAAVGGREKKVFSMTKIDIVSGFLGAGKTTLIKKLLAEAFPGEKLVLIENEFGEISIDGGFLKDSGVQISEMSSGCICCSLVGDFNKALKDVHEQFHPDRILIEPSGVGKLSDVIRAVAARESAVFVGRCADYILRENPRCVNVFLTADDADRIGRIRRRQGCTAEEARAMMERVDARRASYYNYYSSRTWGEAATYHLCVSTSPLGDEGTADFILEFAARKLNMKF